MPRISSFYGIVITMFYKEDHGVPHFHVYYAEHNASVSIETLEVLAGSLPKRALKLVQEWAALHRDDLSTNWDRARAEDPLEQIDPLP